MTRGRAAVGADVIWGAANCIRLVKIIAHMAKWPRVSRPIETGILIINASQLAAPQYAEVLRAHPQMS